MLSIEERLRNAKNDVDGMNRLQAAKGHTIVAGRNVVLPNEKERKDVEDAPSKLLFVSKGPQDDDIRLTIDGVAISDTQLIASGYLGSTVVGNLNNNDFVSFGFRTVTVTKEQAIAAGAGWSLGATVNVDVFDGWGPEIRKAPWVVTIEFSSGRIVNKTGGSFFLGDSTSFIPGSNSAPDYYLTGPHFFDYHENGSFQLN